MSHSRSSIPKHGSGKRNTKKKVNIILKNTIGPEDQVKKVRIPVNTPVSKLKAKIAEVYGLDPDDFQLSHIPSKVRRQEEKSETRQSQKQKVPDASEYDSGKSELKLTKQGVRIILRDKNGSKKFETEVEIPDVITIGELRTQVAEKFGVDASEFHLSLEKYV